MSVSGEERPLFARFVPPLLRSAPHAGYRTSFEAVCLSVDVAGFSRLVERLHRRGSEGTEQMTVLLGRFFGPAIGRLTDAHGQVIGFAGDSMTVVFPHAPADRGLVLEQALGATQGVLTAARAMAGLETLVGAVDIRVRAGVGVGRVSLAALGNDRELVPVARGAGIDAAVAAQLTAGENQLAVQPGLSVRSGRASVMHEPAPANEPGEAGDDDAAFARFLPSVVAERIRSGHRGLVDEHRRVTAAFVGLAEPGGSDMASRIVPLALEMAEHYRGALLSVDCTDKGTALLLSFGAPQSHPDDAARAVACLHELDQRESGALRMGVTTGECFSGIVGSEVQAVYTVCGDSINLAARLMQLASPGQILADEATRAGAGASFRWSTPERSRVKGKVEPVALAVLEGVSTHRPDSTSGRARHPRGREAELARVGRALQSALGGRGRALCVFGPAGVGKSRFARAAVEDARGRDVLVAEGGFDVTTTRSPYAGMRTVWRALLDLPDAATEGDLVGRLEHLGPEVAGFGPVLAPVMGLSLADTQATAALAPTERVEMVRALLLRLLERGGAARPWMIVLDDCHWVDSSSRDLLDFLRPRLVSLPVVLLLLERDGAPPVFEPADDVEQLELHELAPSDAEAVARDLLRGEDPELAAQLAGRSGGNPLLLEELVRLARDGVRDPLPRDLVGLVSAVLDRLPPDQQATIKAASVLGRRFRRRELLGCFAETADLVPTTRSLTALRARGLLPDDETQREGAYTFRSDTLQEVAYHGLSHATRRRLHDAAAGWFEREHAADLDPHLDLLAHHYGLGADAEKQRQYFGLAGRRSARLFANDVAIGYFERLVPLVAVAERAGPLRELGELYSHVGRPRDAEETLRAAIEAGGTEPDPLALAAIGRFFAERLSLREARAWLVRAEGRARAAGDDAARLTALEGLAIALGQGGDYTGAERCSRDQLELARRLGDEGGEAAALMNLAVNRNDQGDVDDAYGKLRDAHRIVSQRGLGRLRWAIESMLFIVCSRRGDLDESLQRLHEAEQTARSIGYELGLAQTVGNEAQLLLGLGDREGAAAKAAESLRAALGVGDPRAVVLALVILGDVLPSGDATGELFARAELVARSVDDRHTLAGVLLARGRAERGRGDAAAASRVFAEALECAEGVNQDAADEARIGCVMVDFERGALSRDAAATQLCAVADDTVNEQTRAVARYERTQVLRDAEPRRDAASAPDVPATPPPWLADDVIADLLHGVDALLSSMSRAAPRTVAGRGAATR